MKKALIIPLILLTIIAKGYDVKGIKFEHGLSWSQVKAKAQKEHKYIFLDVYTTWCVPCRMMAAKIFPQTEVGDFFNNNFINVKVQADRTKKDNMEVKSWYKGTKALLLNNKIDAYPTYLFFSPDGILVNSIIGATENAGDFITQAKLSLNPNAQFNSLKKEYEAGRRDTEFLLNLANATQLTHNNKFLPTFINAYLLTQKNLLTDKNLNFIIAGTTKSTDPGFKILINNQPEVDKICGTGKSADIVNSILFDELVLPLVRVNGKKEDYGGGMIAYSGDIINNINWDTVKYVLSKKYPQYSEKTTLISKSIYYQWKLDWPGYTQSISTYINKFPNDISLDEINTYAYTILSICDDKNCINSAAEWSGITISNKEHFKPYYLYTYTNLLYKAGEKDKAIKILQDALMNPESGTTYFTDLLNKIKKNEKTW